MGLLSNIGHFFLGGKAKSSSSGTTTSSGTTNPYAPAIGPVNDYLASAGKLFNGGAPQISPLEQQGYDALSVTAGSSPDLAAATAANSATVSGKYLTPDTNPYLKDIADRVAGSTMATINQTFGGKGRTGSGLHQELSGEGVGHALTDLYGENYSNERGLQEAAIGRTPQMDAARYLAPTSMISAGQQVSARPFDISAQYGSILGNIAKLGTSVNTSGTTTGNTSGRSESNGWLLNKLFPA